MLPIPDGIPVMSLGFRSQTLDRELQRAWGSKNTHAFEFENRQTS